ncbi:rho GTPase-activating protein 18-like isoform X2 [Antedon mediterranea]|uniref:rho GTPase-activating protein 18-like isoform X2 n=1 Tax=Antedon mediterranea TaxID=105859 RepID=UPI003AF855E4
MLKEAHTLLCCCCRPRSKTQSGIVYFTLDGEQEVHWLKEAGFHQLTHRFKDGDECDDASLREVTSSLTRSQAEAVRRRVAVLNETIRIKRESMVFGGGSGQAVPPTSNSGRKDVRNIFPDHDRYVPVPVSDSNPTNSNQHSWRSDSNDSSRRSLSKSRDSKGVPGLGEGGATGVEVLSITNTQPVQVPSAKDEEGASKDDTRSSTPDSILDLETLESDFRKQEEIMNSLASNLPNITLARDKCGLTPINFLEQKDRSKVRSLALIELTSLFDKYGLPLPHARKQNRKKTKENGIFGVPLNVLIENDKKLKPNVRVPLFLQQLISKLEEKALTDEGVLRVPGSAARIRVLKQDIEENFYDGKFNFDEIRVNDMVGLLKQFLRELPTPILMMEYISGFAQIERIPDRKRQLQCLNLLILVLSDVHRATLKLLLQFLSKVVANERYNKMTLNNVAMIMAPNLFTAKASHKKSPVFDELYMAAGISNVMRMLIRYHHILWVVPTKMLLQVRKIYEAETRKSKDSKSVMTLFKGRGKGDKKMSQYEEDARDGVIRVRAPEFTKICTTIQLSEKTTAGDIVAKFIRDAEPIITLPTRRPSQTKYEKKAATLQSRQPSIDDCGVGNIMYKNKFYLYEIGGNLCGRCLDPETDMLTIVKINPTAEWIIKSRHT